MAQLLSNIHSTSSILKKDSFMYEVDALFIKIKELNISILKGGEEYLYKFFLTYIDKMEKPTHLKYFLSELKKFIGEDTDIFPIETHNLYNLVLCDFIDKKRVILSSTDDWGTKTIAYFFYFFREVPHLPDTFFNIMSQMICGKRNWEPIQIATILRLMEGYRDISIGKTIIQNCYNLILGFNYEDYSFNQIQSMIIVLEHHDIEIPIDLLNHWNTLQNEESHKHYTQTKYEKYIFNNILTDYSFEGYSLEQNVYICGYEVDIVMYDKKGAIFAIIESDGMVHSDKKTKIKDRRRDELFLRKGIADIIIRCGIDGNQILCKEEKPPVSVPKVNITPLNQKKLTCLQDKFAR